MLAMVLSTALDYYLVSQVQKAAAYKVSGNCLCATPSVYPVYHKLCPFYNAESKHAWIGC